MEKHMDTDANAAARERLSAMVDGELDVAGATQVFTRWREDDQCRADWHAYHLIGDVLRSEDLAQGAPHDAGFLKGVRERLVREPVVLAPRPAVTQDVSDRVVARGWRRAWLAPTAVAAGFVVVAGALTLVRPDLLRDRSTGQGIAQAPLVSPAGPGVNLPRALEPVAAVAEQTGSDQPRALLAENELVRDARLDRYLSAHKQFAGSSALGVPSAYLRNATLEAGGR
jgi:sigma-E factor negative regulatory protein RseA